MLTDDDKQWMQTQLERFSERDREWTLVQLERFSEHDREWTLVQLERFSERDREWTLVQLERVETKLLSEFHKWASPVELRIRSHSAVLRAMDLEVEAVSDRVTKLEGTA